MYMYLSTSKYDFSWPRLTLRPYFKLNGVEKCEIFSKINNTQENYS